ncbi:MAG: hypothetical protein KatS3mg131_1522 [Candidatus Tectimicrobiota bacterium]|nr:MAG: hypothetical protein KatS3mg131_1522 [Candidatus Tectomicrobia bacterium]
MCPRSCLAALLLGTLVAMGSQSVADEVYLDNGDRLSGTLQALAAGRLHLHTDYAGELAVAWSRVVAVHSERPLRLVYRDGRVSVGWLVRTEAGEGLLLTEDAQSPFRPEALVALQPLPERPALQRPALWRSEVEAGLQAQTGNTEAVNTALALRTRRQAAVSTFTASAAATFGEAEGQRTAQRAMLEARLQRAHGERFFSFGVLSAEHDALQELALRTQQEAGLGYVLLHTPRTRLQAEVGFGLSQELFQAQALRLEPSGRFGLAWTQKLGTASELSASVVVRPELVDLGDYRLQGETTLAAPLSQRLTLRFSLLARFQSQPQPGVEASDLALQSSLAWAF